MTYIFITTVSLVRVKSFHLSKWKIEAKLVPPPPANHFIPCCFSGGLFLVFSSFLLCRLVHFLLLVFLTERESREMLEKLLRQNGFPLLVFLLSQ